MKKKEKFYPENKQEDEDGYTLHPENATNYENIKKKQDSSPGGNTEHSSHVPANLRSRSFSASPAANQE
jgi:hypothetical protein